MLGPEGRAARTPTDRLPIQIALQGPYFLWGEIEQRIAQGEAEPSTVLLG